MATVSDSSIMTLAQDIVTDFVDGKVTLNEGVMKKASENGFNVDQTQRLIERTNTEAFLRRFPETTEFEVADPGVILGKTASKTASISLYNDTSTDSEEGMFKAASVNKGETRRKDRFQEKIASISSEDIFGLNGVTVDPLPSAIDPETRKYNDCLAEMQKEASQKKVDAMAKETAFNEQVEDIAEYIKQASLSGTQSIKDSEAELLNMFPDNTNGVRILYDNIVEKMASEKVMPNLLTRSEDITHTKLAHETELTSKFKKLLEIASH